MKEYLGFIVLFAVLAVFSLWQMDRANEAEAESVRKQARLDVQAETIAKLEEIGKRIDAALEARRGEDEEITLAREQTRRTTKAEARKDPSLQEQLDTPLHPALHTGGGLLGARGRQDGRVPGGTGGAAHADPGP